MEQNKQCTYNVLWVEDNDTEVEGYQSRGRRFGLSLVRVSNLDEAKKKLDAGFEDYSAIILDAACKIHETDEVDKESFIPVILPKLSEIFATKQKYIPWYILSAGTMKQFNFVIDAAQEYRIEFKEEWGEMVFKKDAPDGEPSSPESLFRQICKVAEEKAQNSVLYRHQDVFSYLGRGRLINFPEAREYMRDMLGRLYFPKGNHEYEGNSIRKVLEYLFRTAEKMGLVPDGFVDSNRLSDSSKFMAGQTVPYKKDSSDSIRWGKEGKDFIFDSYMELCVRNILRYSNLASHTKGKKERPLLEGEEMKELFFGYAIQLCYVIRWFGKYVKMHPDPEKNRKVHRIVKNTGDISCGDLIGREGYVLNAGKFYYVLSCRLSPECAALVKVSDKVVIRDVVENDDEETKAEYPFIATKITPVTEE